VFASLRWSDDHGQSWPSQNVSTGFALPSESAQLQTYDLRCVGEGDDVWVMYGLASGPSSATAIPPLDSIQVAHSGDAGMTWTERATITRADTLFLRPEIAREPSGALQVIAYSGSAEGDTNGAVRRWRSSDGGQSFVEQAVVHAPIVFTGERGNTTTLWIGDYSGLAVDQGELFSSYVDNSSGSAHVAFSRLPLD
jgi:hypothetical protein